MAEYTANALQTVEINGSVLFDAESMSCCKKIPHRANSGLFELRGGNRYNIAFSGNITGATAGTPVALAIALVGEELPATRMISTPAAANDLNDVAKFVTVCVPCGCCYSLTVKNVGTTALDVQNAILDIEEVRHG